MKKTTNEPKKKAAPKKAPKKSARKRDDYEEIDATDGFAVSMEYTGED